MQGSCSSDGAAAAGRAGGVRACGLPSQRLQHVSHRHIAGPDGLAWRGMADTHQKTRHLEAQARKVMPAMARGWSVTQGARCMPHTFGACAEQVSMLAAGAAWASARPPTHPDPHVGPRPQQLCAAFLQ
jgi:hypothetical protein